MARTGFTDQRGNYILRGVPPGEYVLMAWEEVDNGAAEDPEYRKPYESKAVAVKIDEKGASTASLEVIARPAKQ
jgi:hypothetical protein